MQINLFILIRKTLISQLLDKITKICSVTFFARVQAIFTEKISPLALKLREPF